MPASSVSRHLFLVMREQIKFIQAEMPSQVKEARELFIEYSEGLGLDLCFQNFEKELAELPGGYAPPEGRLFLAVSGEKVAGCVGLRKIADGTCGISRGQH